MNLLDPSEVLVYYDGPVAYGVFTLGGDIYYGHMVRDHGHIVWNDGQWHNGEPAMFAFTKLTQAQYDDLLEGRTTIIESFRSGSHVFLQQSDWSDAAVTSFEIIEELLPGDGITLPGP